MAQKLKFPLGRLENMDGKGENSDYQYFFPQTAVSLGIKVNI